MPLIELSTGIRAPIERVFDLARSIDAHVASTGQTRERAVAGRTSGLIELGGNCDLGSPAFRREAATYRKDFRDGDSSFL